MAQSAQERTALIDRYARGPALLKAALAKIPPDALKWRPEPKRWSAHEIIVHCADAESNAHMRLRYLLAEDQPVIQGYDQDRWAALLLGIVNAVIRPILLVLTFPLTVVTLGLFIFVVNGVSLALVAWLMPGFTLSGFGAAILGSIVVGLTGWFASMFVGSAGRIERIKRVEVSGRRLE